MHCTQCGAPGDGRFCGACGATLKEVHCRACGAPAVPGRRFCTQCGTALGAGPPEAGSPGRQSAATAGGGSTAASGGEPAGAGAGPRGAASPGDGGDLGWWVSGVLLVVILVAGGWAVLGDDSDGGSAGAPGMTAPAGGAGGAQGLGPAPNVDLSSMTSREAADALFDRVMTSLSQRDTTQVVNFLPMALDAYELAEPLDLDGLFHVSLLRWTAGDHEGALEVADEALAEAPDHLLALGAGAQAARELGRDDLAADYYRRMLEAWNEEQARDDRPEYEDHAPLLPDLRGEAEAYLGGDASGAEEPGAEGGN